MKDRKRAPFVGYEPFRIYGQDCGGKRKCYALEAPERTAFSFGAETLAGVKISGTLLFAFANGEVEYEIEDAEPSGDSLGCRKIRDDLAPWTPLEPADAL